MQRSWECRSVSSKEVEEKLITDSRPGSYTRAVNNSVPRLRVEACGGDQPLTMVHRRSGQMAAFPGGLTIGAGRPCFSVTVLASRKDRRKNGKAFFIPSGRGWPHPTTPTNWQWHGGSRSGRAPRPLDTPNGCRVRPPNRSNHVTVYREVRAAGLRATIQPVAVFVLLGFPYSSQHRHQEAMRRGRLLQPGFCCGGGI